MPKILIVEDETEVRKILTEMISDLGFDVHGAGDGAEALRMIEQGSYNLVLSDIQMPGMTGIELLSTLRQRKINLPFIVLSAYGEKDKMDAAQRLGAFDFLEKPFSFATLSKTIQRAVDSTQ